MIPPVDPPKKPLQPHEIKVQMYLRECRKLQVIPVGAYIRQPTQNALVIRHYNMGPNGARALAAPLMVCLYFCILSKALTGDNFS